jgi:hypothetical protein
MDPFGLATFIRIALTLTAGSGSALKPMRIHNTGLILIRTGSGFNRVSCYSTVLARNPDSGHCYLEVTT